MKTTRWFAFLAAAFLVSESSIASELLIRGAKVYTLTSPNPMERTDVLVRNRMIVAVGKNLTAAAGAPIMDAANHPLTPGLWGGLSEVGVIEIPREGDTADASQGADSPPWHQQWRPEFDVTLAYNPRSSVVPITRIEGVTWTVLDPSSGDSIVGGQGAAVTLDGTYDAVLRGSRSLFVQLGGGIRKISNGSRAGQYMLLDQAIREARASGTSAEGALLHPAGREALLRYLDGGRVVFAVERAADILQLIAFVQRAGIKPVIAGGSEAWVVAKELARADIPVILDPLQNLPSGFDQLASRLDNAARLHQAGVRIAFSGGYPRGIRQPAGNAVAAGLPWNVALASITSTPAEIFGLGADRGRIAPGQIADLVLWDGDPLEVTTIAKQVWIAGQPVTMRSRQTVLRDRYLPRANPN
jgi:hypothetical protein